MWMVRRALPYRAQPMTAWRPGYVNSGSTGNRLANERLGLRQVNARRYAPFLLDEIQRGDGSIYRPLPWWAPFNALLHQWRTHDDELMHDHPRWSVTIMLKGQLVEKTPWGERVLRPGSVVLRTSRFIHGFRVEREHSASTWTLFIVGRRRRCQNTYIVTRRTEAASR